MKEPLISIVIPVYNVEKSFPRCMESVLSQTYMHYEVILVDDGSSDHSGEMCDKYAKLHSQIRVYHQQNKGQSVARNLGVLRSKGSLIVFVDSDDCISSDYLEYLYMLMKKYSVSISCARIEKCSSSVDCINTTGYESVYTAEQAIEKMCYRDMIDVTPCAKLYKKEILLKYPYPEGRVYEDLAVACKHIAEAGSIAVGDRIIYYYITHYGSTMYGEVEEKHFDAFRAADEQKDYIATNFPRIEYAAKARCAWVAIAMLGSYDIFRKKESKVYFYQIRDYLKPYMKIVLTDSKLSVHLKMKSLIIMIGYYPSKFIWYYIKKLVLKRRENKIVELYL